jgi:hypothetical protein
MSSEKVKPFVLDTAHKNEIIRSALIDYSGDYALPDESLDDDTYSLQLALHIRSRITNDMIINYSLPDPERQAQIKTKNQVLIDIFNSIDTDKLRTLEDAYMISNTIFSRGDSYYTKPTQLIDGFNKEKLKFFVNQTAKFLFQKDSPHNLISRREQFSRFFWYANFITDPGGRTYPPKANEDLKYNLYDYLDESMHLTVAGSKAAEFFEMYYRRLAGNMPTPIEFKKIYVKRPEILRVFLMSEKLTVQHLLLLTNVAKEKDKALVISLLEKKQVD